ncbi:MAG: hypothetical protein KatS3mg007_0759 [Thermoanaerobaculum sp.]|nr:MAG: hypothetical protein KatS3mg007_0759 [Thermoanaerobaculum sp.]
MWPLVLALVAQVPQFSEKVEVRRVVLQVRVLGADGSPVLGLKANNFRVLVDGKEVIPDVVEWVDLSSTGKAPSGETGAAPESQHLVVVLVQRDLQRARASGLLAFQGRAAEVVEGLPENFKVALLIQDSRLHLVQDFTQDHRRVAEILRQGLFRALPYRAGEPEGPSLRRFLDEETCARAATPEKGLRFLAQALASLPGHRQVILLGWGLGRLSFPGVYMPADYVAASALLEASGIPVFSLDITDADWHTLEIGLIHAAEDTGGLYAKTHLFPAQAQKKLAGALAGYYEVSFPRPEGPVGVHQVEVQLRGVQGNVFCRRTFADPPGLQLP